MNVDDNLTGATGQRAGWLRATRAKFRHRGRPTSPPVPCNGGGQFGVEVLMMWQTAVRSQSAGSSRRARAASRLSSPWRRWSSAIRSPRENGPLLDQLADMVAGRFAVVAER